jgi:hypothetical protein
MIADERQRGLRETPTHAVHLYADDGDGLTTSATRFLAAGKRDGGLMVVAGTGHVTSIRAALRAQGASNVEREDAGLHRFLDAQGMLASFMVGGYPDESRFLATVGQAVLAMHRVAAGRGVRIYGEMVGVLWEQRQYPCAIRLEQLWNQLQRTVPFDLYCGYPIDVLDAQYEVGVLGGLLGAHSEFVCSDGSVDLAAERRCGNYGLRFTGNTTRISVP